MTKSLRILFSAPLLFLFISTTAQTGPQLVWANQFDGGQTLVNSYPIALDASNNVYVAGYFEGTVDFDPGPNTYNLTALGTQDIFVIKLDSMGNLIWVKQFGGAGAGSLSLSIAVDTNGNVYTTGIFKGTVDFDPGSGIFNLSSFVNTSGFITRDVFISKLNSNGDFVWAEQIEGEGLDRGWSLASDDFGNIIVMGEFTGTVDFDPGSGTFNLDSENGDFFISKLNTSGNFVWTKQVDANQSYSVTTDNSGNIYTLGNFEGTVDFNPGTSVFNLTANGNYNIFVSKLDSNGDFVWAKQLIADNATGYSIKIDGSGNVYTIGTFTGTLDFDPGTGTLTSNGGLDVFVCKLDTSGNFLWVKQIGGVNTDYGISLALDNSANVYTTGSFIGTVDFDPGPGVFNLASGGAFLSKLDTFGNFVWAKQFDGNGIGFSIALDSSGDIHTSGFFNGIVDFDPGSGTFNMDSGTTPDIYILKLENNLGINENSYNKKILIYPNPVSKKLTISSKSTKIEKIRVYDFLGRKILEQSSNKMNTVLDMEKLSSGIYVVKVIAGGKTASYKIVKE